MQPVTLLFISLALPAIQLAPAALHQGNGNGDAAGEKLVLYTCPT
jgi:hypothetical protein